MTSRHILLRRKSFRRQAGPIFATPLIIRPRERTARPERKDPPAQGAQPKRQAQRRRADRACPIKRLVKALLSAGVSDCQSDVGIAQPSSRIVNSIARRLMRPAPIIYFGEYIT
jgi:hypothetical protein